MSDPIEWVKTPIAAQKTGRSRSQLLRLAKDGYLIRGTHWVKGPHENSPITWNCEAIRAYLASTEHMPTPANPDSENHE